MANTLNLGSGKWATKEGSLLAYNSENNNYKPLPFTFDRASSATRVNKDGLIETVGADQPRVDYLNDSNGALLLEPQSRNINPDGGVYNWSKNEASLSTEVQLISPSGNLESVGLVIPNSTGSSTFRGFSRIILGLTSGDLYQYSIFVKKKDARYCMFKLRNTGNNVAFDLDTKQIVGNSNISQGFSFEEYSNGWIRLVLGCNVAADGRIYMGIGCSQALPSGGNDFTGADGSSGMYCTFAQLEAGSYATSYIPTSGSAVTRVADVCTNAGNSTVFNDSEGVLYFEAKTDNTTTGSIAINNGTSSTRLTARFRIDISKIQMTIVGSTDDFNYNSSTITLSEYNKIAIVYNNGQYYFFINGIKSTIKNEGTFSLNSFTQIDFNRGGGNEPFYGKVKDLKVYNTALTDQELIALTT